MLNPSLISGREEKGHRNYFKIKSPLKWPRSNSQPLYLQSDMHLRPDTLSSALPGPLKVMSQEMNVSSGVSKVNIIYILNKSENVTPESVAIYMQNGKPVKQMKVHVTIPRLGYA